MAHQAMDAAPKPVGPAWRDDDVTAPWMVGEKSRKIKRDVSQDGRPRSSLYAFACFKWIKALPTFFLFGLRSVRLLIFLFRHALKRAFITGAIFFWIFLGRDRLATFFNLPMFPQFWQTCHPFPASWFAKVDVTESIPRTISHSFRLTVGRRMAKLGARLNRLQLLLGVSQSR